MKDLIKIYRRYIFTVILVATLVIAVNIVLYFAFLISHYYYKTQEAYWEWRIPAIAEALTPEGGSYTLPEEALQRLDAEYAFAMLLNEQGEVIWSYHLPDDVPLSYSLSDVAAMTRWYLKDYPVKVWKHPDGLFVLASPKDSLWKQSIQIETPVIAHAPACLGGILLFNLALILLLSLFFGHRFYLSLKSLANGIENLTGREPLALPERGNTASLARKLNEASSVLSQQRTALEKRDNARTSWIAGVSHDIRTPLSLIMGHADNLEQSTELGAAYKKEAAAIRDNSLQIKKLIEDLNLTSKLEYNSYPLRLSEYAPAALIRELAAFYMNNDLAQAYPFEIEIAPELEGLTLTGDKELLFRAFRNLTDNSIRHNPLGCTICIQSFLSKGQLQIRFSDTGKGIPLTVIKTLYRQNASSPHVMGLRVVKQILEAHGGQVEFEVQKNTCRTVRLLMPL